jgi:hypothetical protein
VHQRNNLGRYPGRYSPDVCETSDITAERGASVVVVRHQRYDFLDSVETFLILNEAMNNLVLGLYLATVEHEG